MCLFICTLVYTVASAIIVFTLMAEGSLKTSSDWVKAIFWPITVLVFLLGVILWLLIWIPRQLFKGLLLCFNDIEYFFIGIFRDAIGKNEES